jgi:HK97 family phage major capsid protein
MALKIDELGKLTEPEVAQAVVDEVNALGDNTKKIYESLRKDYEEIKLTIDKYSEDTLEVEKFHKLGESITIKQQDLDKKFAEYEKKNTERMDAIEVALKRPGRSSGIGADDDKIAKEAKEFYINALSVRRKSNEGVSFEEIQEIAIDKAIEDYNLYKKAFEGWARKYGGNRDTLIQPMEEIKALQVGVDPDGGVTVPVAMSNRMTEIIYESDPVRQLASVESITTGKMEWMAEWDEAGYAWEGEVHGETGIASETSTPTWKKRSISVHTLEARPRATQTLLEDSGINVEQWLAKKIADKFSRGEAAAFVTGNGIGKPKGFLTYSNGTTFGTVEQVAMGLTDALTADGFLSIKYAMKEYYIERGTWLMNRSTVLAALKLKYGDGSYIWNPGQFGSGNTTGNILGLPVRMSTTMPEIAANALAVVLADWKAAYLIVDRLGITVQRDPFTVKPFVEFYTRKRVGGDVDNWEAIKIGKISA